MRRLGSGTAGRRSAGDAALQIPGPRPADPKGHRHRLCGARGRGFAHRAPRTAVGTRPEAIGPPATGSLTRRSTEFAPETSRKARPDCRQDAAMARRTAPRIRKWIRALKRLVAPFGAPSPLAFSLPARTRLKPRTEFPAARTMEHRRNAGRRSHKAQRDHRRYQAPDDRRPLPLPPARGRSTCARPRELPATELPACPALPRSDLSARREMRRGAVRECM